MTAAIVNFQLLRAFLRRTAACACFQFEFSQNPSGFLVEGPGSGRLILFRTGTDAKYLNKGRLVSATSARRRFVIFRPEFGHLTKQTYGIELRFLGCVINSMHDAYVDGNNRVVSAIIR